MMHVTKNQYDTTSQNVTILFDKLLHRINLIQPYSLKRASLHIKDLYSNFKEIILSRRNEWRNIELNCVQTGMMEQDVRSNIFDTVTWSFLTVQRTYMLIWKYIERFCFDTFTCFFFQLSSVINNVQIPERHKREAADSIPGQLKEEEDLGKKYSNIRKIEDLKVPRNSCLTPFEDDKNADEYENKKEMSMNKIYINQQKTGDYDMNRVEVEGKRKEFAARADGVETDSLDYSNFEAEDFIIEKFNEKVGADAQDYSNMWSEKQIQDYLRDLVDILTQDVMVDRNINQIGLIQSSIEFSTQKCIHVNSLNEWIVNIENKISLLEALSNFPYDENVLREKKVSDTHAEKKMYKEMTKQKPSKFKHVSKPLENAKVLALRVLFDIDLVNEILVAMNKCPSVTWAPNFDALLPEERLLQQKARHLGHYFDRLHSFLLGHNKSRRVWDSENFVWPGPLVAAGFSYDGEGDKVVCKHCNCRSDTTQWEDNDEAYAIQKHREGCNGNCPFLQTYSGFPGEQVEEHDMKDHQRKEGHEI